MQKLIGSTSLILLFLLAIFHLMVIFQIIPSDIVWGNQEIPENQIKYFEIFAVFVTLFFMLITASRANYLKNRILYKVSRILIWFVAVYFLLNSVGNLLSRSKYELIIFLPVSFLLSLLSFILAIQKSNNSIYKEDSSKNK